MLVKDAGALVKAARLGAKLTQMEAAKKAGTSQPAWSRIEAGADLGGLDFSTIMAVLKVVGLEFKDILE